MNKKTRRLVQLLCLVIALTMVAGVFLQLLAM